MEYELHKDCWNHILLAQGNVDYSFFDGFNLQLGGYIDTIFGNGIFMKGNLFLCYLLIFRYLLFTMETWILFVYGI